MRFFRRDSRLSADPGVWEFAEVLGKMSSEQWSVVLRTAATRWGAGSLEPDRINAALAADPSIQNFLPLFGNRDAAVQGVRDIASKARQEGRVAEAIAMLHPALSVTNPDDLARFHDLVWLADSLAKTASLAIAFGATLPDDAVSAGLAAFGHVWPVTSATSEVAGGAGAFGAFGPSTGQVLAFDEQIAGFDQGHWRELVRTLLHRSAADLSSVLDALYAIQDQASGIDSTFLDSANRWAKMRNEDRVGALPDAWFDGVLPDGTTAVPSGVKFVAAGVVTLATTALATHHFAPPDLVRRVIGPLLPLVDLELVAARAAAIRQP